MLSIQEIKLTIETLKKFKAKDYEEFFKVYLEKLEDLALKVDAYNDQQIQQLDKTTDWYLADLEWRHQRRASVYDPLLDKLVQTKINQFTRMGTDAKKFNSLEIGPGYGFLTDKILQKKPKKLILIEKDFNLFVYLKNK